MHELSPPPAGARRSRRVEGDEVHEDGRLSRRNVVVAGGPRVAAASVTAVLALKPFGKATAATKSDSMALTAQLKKANAAEAADVASSGTGSATDSGAPPAPPRAAHAGPGARGGGRRQQWHRGGNRLRGNGSRRYGWHCRGDRKGERRSVHH